MFGKRSQPATLQRPLRWGNVWDVSGDGRMLVWDVETYRMEVTLFKNELPLGQIKLVQMANLVLLHKDGFYTFRKDRSGGRYVETLVELGMVQESRIIRDDERSYEVCCPLSERAIRFLALSV